MKKFYSLLAATILSIAVYSQSSIKSIAPLQGPAGTVVSIKGQGFHPGLDSTKIFFGPVSTRAESISDSSITVEVPVGATYQPVTVSSRGYVMQSASFFMPTSPTNAAQFEPGSFMPKQDLKPGFFPHAVELGDIDADGQAELIVARGSSPEVVIYKNAIGGGLNYTRRVTIFSGQHHNEATAFTDFNGDGLADLAVLSSTQAYLHVYANNGNLDFLQFTRKTYPAGSGTYCLAVGDLNNDGRTDMAAASNGGTRIQLFKNKSSYSGIDFDTLSMESGSNPYGIAIHDLDGDGRRDIVLSTQQSGSRIWVYRNIGTGDTIQFAAPLFIGSVSAPFAVSIADIDNDGKADIIAAGAGGNSLAVIRNTSNPGNMQFADQINFLTGSYPVHVALGDLDGDGRVDLVSANRYGNTVSVLRNTSTPGVLQFAAHQEYPVGPAPLYVMIGDLDGDGRPDIAAANSSDSSVSLLRNIHGLDIAPKIFSFSPSSAPENGTVQITGKNLSATTAVQFGGINASSFTKSGDTLIIATVGKGQTGDLKIISPNGEISKPGFVYTGPTIQSFAPISGHTGTTVTIIGRNFSNVTGVDFGGVAAKSFTVISATSIQAVVGNGATGLVKVHTNQGVAELTGFSFGLPVIQAFYPRNGHALSIVQLQVKNVSPVPDSNLVHFGAVRAKVISLRGDTMNVEVPVGATFKPISLTVNGLIAYSAQPFMPTFANENLTINDKSFLIAGSFPVGQYPRVLEAADFDGDGKADLVTANANSNNISVLQNKGSVGAPAFAAAKHFATGNAPIRMHVADLDGDGRTDVIVTNSNAGLDGSVSILRNTSSLNNISFQDKIDLPAGRGSVGLAIADFNLDGKTDIIVASGNSSAMFVFINSSLPGGALSFNMPIVIPTGGHLNHIISADINNDRKPDIIGTRSGSQTLLVYPNTTVDGMLSFATPSGFSTGGFPNGLVAADLDHNNLTDIIVSNYADGTATVWYNFESGPVISFVAKQTFQLNTTIPVLADLNGDAESDLVTGKYIDGRFTILQNRIGPGQTAPFTDSISFAAGEYDSYVTAGDFDGDGKTDIAVGNTVSSSVRIFTNRLASPAIHNYLPASGGTGTEVTITGTALSKISSVTVGGTAVRSFRIVSDKQLIAVLGEGSSGKIKLSGIGGTVESGQFRFIPVISAQGALVFCGGNSVVLRSSDSKNNQWYRSGVLIDGARGQQYVATQSGDYSVRTRLDTSVIESTNKIAVLVLSTQKPVIAMDTTGNLNWFGGQTGQWYINGEMVPGGISRSIKPEREGLYTFRANISGCISDFSDAYVFKIQNTIELGGNQHINLYPNPAVADMRVVWKIDGDPKMNIELTDSQGRPVLLKQEAVSGSVIYIGGLKKGIYYMRIFNLELKISITSVIMKQ